MRGQGVVEAALFSAGAPLTAEEITRTTGLRPDDVRAALEALAKVYDERDSAIEVARIGDKWTMQIRATYGEAARPFAPTELPADLLKTAALIAYHQPMKQSDLVRMLGGKAYDHVRALQDFRLITTKPFRHTLELKTSETFPEFFGLPVANREELKRVLSDRMGPSAALATAPGPHRSAQTGDRGKHV